jgi:hypothetical protein
MAEGFITRRGGVAAVEQVAAPTITQVSLAETSITFTIKNNDTSAATIVYRISSSTADGESFTLAADTTSANITIGGLDDDTSYTIFASANVEGKIKSDLTEFPFTTPELVTFISATGGTTTTYTENNKFYKSHTFTSSGNFVVSSLSNQAGLNDVDYLIIAGGGAGGSDFESGGGGAGGYRTTLGTSGGNSTAESKVTVTAQTYGITIGAGGSAFVGTGGTAIRSGNDSLALGITSIAGGGGGNELVNGANGGSGGGTSRTRTAGSGTTGQGFAGGSSGTGGGGGGAGQIGETGPSRENGGDGGDGLANTLRTGSSETRAGGGGGSGSTTIGLGGAGGGGNGGGSTTATSGTVNTGSGGGGKRFQANTSGNGGSGIVVIRYEVGAL